jgi:hypothetical protein
VLEVGVRRPAQHCGHLRPGVRLRSLDLLKELALGVVLAVIRAVDIVLVDDLFERLLRTLKVLRVMVYSFEKVTANLIMSEVCVSLILVL